MGPRSQYQHREAWTQKTTALLGALAVATSTLGSGCLPYRSEAPAVNQPEERPDWIGQPRAVPPPLAPDMLGTPYRDLRQHTGAPLGTIMGIDVSPDGTALLYASMQDGPTPNIFLKEENSATVARKTSSPWWDLHPAFSPNGKWIAFASNREGNFDIWIIPAGAAGGAEQVTSSSDDEVHPAWSPDGTKLVFCRLSEKHGWNLWIFDRENHTAVELGAGFLPDWSPTAEWIAFQKPSNWEPRWFGLWIVRPDGSELRRVVAGTDFGAVEPTWSPGGNLLAFTALKDRNHTPGEDPAGDVWVVNVDKGKMYQITTGPEADNDPAWGLGGRIYFTSNRLGQDGIWSLIPPEVEG